MKKFLALPIWRDYRTLLVLYIILAVISAIIKYDKSDNNFLIYKYVFWNVIEQKDLYIHYPEKFGDLNHYGPFFSAVIAPFAVIPKLLGLILWNVCLTLLMWVAVRTSRFSKYEILFMLWYGAHDLLTCLFMQQFNIAVAALILLAFTMTERKKEFWAAFFICAGTFVKLLPIVGIVFFFFASNKRKFFLSIVFWSIVCFVLPMLYSSPEYIIGQYESWYHALQAKNETNIANRLSANNISLLGIVRRITLDTSYSDLWFIVPAMIIAAIGYFRVNQWQYLPFRKTILANVLLITLLFSTGTENSSYMMAGIALPIWYTAAPWRRNNWDIALMIFAFLFGSLSPTDLYPKYIQNEIIRPFALRALPVALIWFKLSYELIFKNYDTVQQTILLRKREGIHA